MVLLTVAMTAPHHHRMACSVQDGPTLAAFTPAAATCALCEFCVPPILPAAAITLILALLVSIATVLSVRRAALCARPLPRGLLRAPPISSFCTVA